MTAKVLRDTFALDGFHAGLLVSYLCFFLAAALFLAEGRERLGEAGAWQSAGFLLLFPTAFFFASVYAGYALYDLIPAGIAFALLAGVSVLAVLLSLLHGPLIAQLGSAEAELRKMAAWCIGTAVQNNVTAQEKLLEMNGIPLLCRLAVEDGDEGVGRKCVYALSSGIRNYQQGMDELVKCLPKDIVGPDQVSASDMEVIDAIMGKLREKE